MKVFEFEIMEEKDWIGAEDKEDAIEFYAKLIGDNYETVTRDYNIRELTDEEASSAMVIDTEDYCDEDDCDDHDEREGGYKILYSMKEATKGMVATDIIATTNY